MTLLRGWVKWPPTRRSKGHESNDLVFTSTLVHLPILDFYSPWRWMTGAFTYIRDIFTYINGWFLMVNFGGSSPQFSDSDHQEYCIFSGESRIRMIICHYYWVGGKSKIKSRYTDIPYLHGSCGHGKLGQVLTILAGTQVSPININKRQFDGRKNKNEACKSRYAFSHNQGSGKLPLMKGN